MAIRNIAGEYFLLCLSRNVVYSIIYHSWLQKHIFSLCWFWFRKILFSLQRPLIVRGLPPLAWLLFLTHASKRMCRWKMKSWKQHNYSYHKVMEQRFRPLCCKWIISFSQFLQISMINVCLCVLLQQSWHQTQAHSLVESLSSEKEVKCQIFIFLSLYRCEAKTHFQNSNDFKNTYAWVMTYFPLYNCVPTSLSLFCRYFHGNYSN